MALINLSVQHGQSLEQARHHLEQTVQTAALRFGPLIRQQGWSSDRNQVKLSGPGFALDLAVDESHVHLSGDITGVLGAVATPLVTGLKQLMEQNFQKRLK